MRFVTSRSPKDPRPFTLLALSDDSLQELNELGSRHGFTAARLLEVSPGATPDPDHSAAIAIILLNCDDRRIAQAAPPSITHLVIPVIDLSASASLELDLLSSLINIYHRAHAALLSDYAHLSLISADLRSETQRLYTAFRDLESEYLRHPHSRRRLVLQLNGDAGSVTAPGARTLGDRNDSLRQRLPITSSGIAAVEVYISRAPSGTEGVLRLALLSNNGRVLAVSERNSSEIGIGWLTLEFSQAISEDERDVDVVVDWIGDSSQAPELRLSHKTPLHRYFLRPAHLREARCVLSLRVWWGPPGTKSPEMVPSRVPVSIYNGGSSGRRLKDIDLDVIASAIAPVGLSPTSHLARWVIYDRVRGQLRIHPEKSNVIAATAPLSLLAPGKQVTATYILDHEKSAPVDVGIAIARRDEVPTALAKFETFLTLRAEQVGDVTLPISSDLDGTEQFIMMTRMANSADVNAFAHAKLLKVTVADENVSLSERDVTRSR
ncbi:DUF6212 domain-containing protein [Hansschlegelia beijingensis]